MTIQHNEQVNSFEAVSPLNRLWQPQKLLLLDILCQDLCKKWSRLFVSLPSLTQLRLSTQCLLHWIYGLQFKQDSVLRLVQCENLSYLEIYIEGVGDPIEEILDLITDLVNVKCLVFNGDDVHHSCQVDMTDCENASNQIITKFPALHSFDSFNVPWNKPFHLMVLTKLASHGRLQSGSIFDNNRKYIPNQQDEIGRFTQVLQEVPQTNFRYFDIVPISEEQTELLRVIEEITPKHL